MTWGPSRHKVRFSALGLASVFLSVFFVSCASTDKPTLKLIYASAAIKGAEKKQAERKVPDKFNRAQKYMWDANKYYLAKEFDRSAKAAENARKMAEIAELEAELKNAASEGLPGEQ